MNREMFIACKKAGLTKKEMAKITNALSGAVKKLQRENETMEELGITVTTFSELEKMEGMMDKVMSKSCGDVTSEEVLNNERSRLITEGLGVLSDEDSEFIKILFFEEDGVVSRMARRMGEPRETVRDRRNRILGELHRYYTRRKITYADF